MSIFNQDIDDSVQNSMLNPGSPFYKEWIYPACKMDDAMLQLDNNILRIGNCFRMELSDRVPLKRFFPNLESLYFERAMVSFTGREMTPDVLATTVVAPAINIETDIIRGIHIKLLHKETIQLKNIKQVSDCFLNAREIYLGNPDLYSLPIFENTTGPTQYITVTYSELKYHELLLRILRTNQDDLIKSLYVYRSNMENLLLPTDPEMNLSDFWDLSGFFQLQGIYFCNPGVRSLLKFLKVGSTLLPMAPNSVSPTRDGWVAAISRYK